MSDLSVSILKDDVEIITLHSGFNTWAESECVIVNFEGWDDVDNISINTVPKLFGPGSYVTSKRIEEQEYKLDGALFTSLARDIRKDLEESAYSMEPVTIIVKRADSNTMAEAYITSLKWTASSDTEAEFTIVMKATDPIKRIGEATSL